VVTITFSHLRHSNIFCVCGKGSEMFREMVGKVGRGRELYEVVLLPFGEVCDDDDITEGGQQRCLIQPC